MATSEKSAPPAGGGTESLGESFSKKLGTGEGSYSYQILLPAGVARHMPRLVLQYADPYVSEAWGFGWRLPMRSISHRVNFCVRQHAEIERFFEDDSELLPCDDGAYRTMGEPAFPRYLRVGEGWRVEERNGQVHEFGLDAAARVYDTCSGRVSQWLLQRSFDPRGDVIEYGYRIEDGFSYLSSARYAPCEVRLVYEGRPDVRHDGRAGFSRRRTLRCTSLEIFLDSGPGERLIRRYRFGYRLALGSGVSHLTQICRTDVGPAPDGSLDVRHPAVTFSYSEFDPRRYLLRWTEGAPASPTMTRVGVGAVGTPKDAPPSVTVMSRDGHHSDDNDPPASRKAGSVYLINTDAAGYSRLSLVPKTGEEIPDLDLSCPDTYLADLTGDGRHDLVHLQSGRVEYWPGLGRGRFGKKVVMANAPRLRRDDVRDKFLFTDLDGDGCADLVHLSPRGIVIYQNQNGQRFANPVCVPAITTPLPGSARAVKVDGQKGMGLVWISGAKVDNRCVRFEFTPETPPYRLASSERSHVFTPDTKEGGGCPGREGKGAGIGLSAGHPADENLPDPGAVPGGEVPADGGGTSASSLEWRFPLGWLAPFDWGIGGIVGAIVGGAIVAALLAAW